MRRYQSEAFQKALRIEQVVPHLRWDEEAEYARNGTQSRSWLKTGNPTIPDWRREDFRIHTGEIAVSRGHKDQLYVVSKNLETALVVETPFEFAGEQLWIDTLDAWSNGKVVFSRIGFNEQIDETGERTLVVEVTSATNGYRTKCKLLPDYDFAVRELESFTNTGQLTDKSITFEHDKLSGLVYPKRGRRDYFSTIDGVVGTTTEFELISIETTPHRIPNPLFQIDIPSDAWVWDADARAMVRNDSQSETYLNEVIRRAGVRPLWKQWVTFMLAVAIAGALAIVLWKWLTLKRAEAVRRSRS
jgi:hypothetical protein